ncbi:MAG: gliding motility-associated C-terminal domain-containing protein [Flavobacteriales bacterium]|nr:gliding motility-associated C-terminal domain-containing protein [Flavobacteriales bacterium]
MKPAALIIGLVLLSANAIRAQSKQNFNWMINNSGLGNLPLAAALDFDNCTPTVLNNTLGSGFEGQSSISDSQSGQLLMYTDGLRMYNANGVVMQNGQVVGITNSQAQNLIVKKPGSASIFYMISPDTQAGLVVNTNFPTASGLKYAEVDMSLDGGLGAVTSAFNVLKAPGNCEMITGVYHANGEDIWLIGHEYGNNNFYTFLVTAAGINPVPTLTAAGPVVFTAPPGVPANSNFDAIGELKASPDGSKLAFTTFFNGFTCLVDFDNATGAISNPIELSIDGGGYGTSFSPDNTKLYFTGYESGNLAFNVNNSIYQFDISSNDAVTIQNSRTTIFTDVAGFKSLKLGPDRKLYVARATAVQLGNGAPYLGVINEPDNAGLACNYVHDGVFLNGPYGTWGLNNSIEDFFDCNALQFTLGPDTVICPGDSVVLSAIADQSSYLWNTGQATSSITVSQAGTYWVEVSGPDGTASDTVVVGNHVLAPLVITGPAAVCPGAPAALLAAPGFASYQWSTGSTANPLLAGAGAWSVTATDTTTCQTTASFTVAEFALAGLSITGEPAVCAGQVTELVASAGLSSYAWNTGADSIAVSVGPGLWSVSAVDTNGCLNSALFEVAQLDAPLARIISPDEFCDGVPAFLSAEDYPDQELLWNTGGTEASIAVGSNGTYALTASNACGTASDSIRVRFDNCDCGIFVPNSFTPNGDGTNEVWQPVVCPALAYEAAVYDRWGIRIFQTTDPNEAWTGTFGGADDPAPIGVYTYTVNVTEEQGAPKALVGHVTLVR